MTPDGNYNGWGIRYYGDTGDIYVGWWRNSVLYGNGIIIDGGDWTVKEKGWFGKSGKCRAEKPGETVYRVFRLEDVVLNSSGE